MDFTAKKAPANERLDEEFRASEQLSAESLSAAGEFQDAEDNKPVEPIHPLERIKQLYQRYPKLSKTLLASIIIHAIIIFYMPPEYITLMFGPPGNSETGQPLQITLTGDLADVQQAADQGENEGDQSGDFSGSVDGKWADLLQRLEANKNLSQSFPQKYEDLYSDGRVSDSYIRRNRQHEDIVVKEVFPTIYEIDKPFKDILAAAPKKLDEYMERNEVIEEFRNWNEGKTKNVIKLNISDNKKGKVKKGPLHFAKPDRSKYFDDTLKQSKESQLSNFIRQYFDYDPDQGDLPIATRELYYDNLQRLAYPFSSDPTYFYLDYYLENLNKEDFLNHSIYQAAQLDGSKTQTELLFALQDIYHIQQRAWNNYFNFKSLYKRLPQERKNRLRTETLRRVDQRYEQVLADKNIKNYQEIRDLYTKKRTEIMDYILEKSPQQYRTADARFERAAIQWEHGVDSNKSEELDAAAKDWLELQNLMQNSSADEFLNKSALQKMLPWLQRFTASKTPLEKRSLQVRIDQLLQFRFQDRLQQKRQREEKILWPKNAGETGSKNANKNANKNGRNHG